MSRLRSCRFIICILLILSLGGCQAVSFYGQAVWGHARIMLSQRPITELLNDPGTPPRLRAKLAYVCELREFAAGELRLPVGDSYRTYADIGRAHVVWNVFAAPELSLTPKTWCYPIAGCAAYRGYFEQAAAERYAASLSRDGYDVFVWGATAYSTLGWFDDPVLSTFLGLDSAQLAALMFHELAHRQLYIPGDSAFNEGFASAVEQTGLQRWAAARSEPDLPAAADSRRQLQQEFYAWVSGSLHELQAVYASDLPAAEKRIRKAAIVSQRLREFENLKRQQSGLSRYDRWLGTGLNNAGLASVSTYRELVPAFERLLEQSNGELSVFYERCRALARLPDAERHAQMQRLMAPTS
jgi:predicted aminopeptidase